MEIRYRNRSSILTIEEICKFFFIFRSMQRRNTKIYFEFRHLRHAKTLTFPQELSKKMLIYLQNFCVQASFNESAKNSRFPSVLKQANITLVFRKGGKEYENN